MSGLAAPAPAVGLCLVSLCVALLGVVIRTGASWPFT